MAQAQTLRKAAEDMARFAADVRATITEDTYRDAASLRGEGTMEAVVFCKHLRPGMVPEAILAHRKLVERARDDLLSMGLVETDYIQAIYHLHNYLDASRQARWEHGIGWKLIAPKVAGSPSRRKARKPRRQQVAAPAASASPARPDLEPLPLPARANGNGHPIVGGTV